MRQVLFVPTLLCAAWTVGAASHAPSQLLYPGLEGRAYAQARAFLKSRGYQPLDFRQARGTSCDFSPAGTCRFDEMEACAADIPECVFVWKTKDGHFIHVYTGTASEKPSFPISSIQERDYD